MGLKKLQIYGTPSTGVLEKPQWCYDNCPRCTCSGFVADYVPDMPRIAVMFALPEKDDVTDRMPASSGYGRFFHAAILKELGLTRKDVLLSHALRCYSREYPVGVETDAERTCRYFDSVGRNYDGTPNAEKPSLATWSPNLFIPTFALDKMVEIGAYYSLGLADFQKALRFADAGYRPLILMGTEVMKIHAPWLSGGVKQWRGTWWTGEYKWKDTQDLTAKTILLKTETGGFQATKSSRGWRPKPTGQRRKKKEPAQSTLFQ